MRADRWAGPVIVSAKGLGKANELLILTFEPGEGSLVNTSNNSNDFIFSTTPHPNRPWQREIGSFHCFQRRGSW